MRASEVRGWIRDHAGRRHGPCDGHAEASFLVLLVDPRIAKTVIDTDRGRDEVLDLASRNGRELKLKHPGDRHVLDQDLLRLLVDLLALGVRGCGCAFSK